MAAEMNVEDEKRYKLARVAELRRHLSLEDAVLGSTDGEARRLHALGFAAERRELARLEAELE